MGQFILGISAFYHDSAACLLSNGELLAAAQEERFTRKKHDSAFPLQASQYCLEAAGLRLDQIDHVVFYDKPLLKFERLLETYLQFAPEGCSSFIKAVPVWLKEKLFLKRLLRENLAKLGSGKVPELLFCEHHRSHAASAFFPSPFERAAVLCLDGVGEWATSSVWLGEKNRLIPQWQMDFPHSLGLLYSAFTYFTGFKVNSGEYKLMGLAPYGQPIYQDLIRRELIDIKTDGTFRLNLNYFNFATGLTMTNKKFATLFGGPARSPESPLTQREMDLAASVQVVTEEIVLKLGRTIRQELGVENLCLAGGVALNCVANGKLSREKIFENIWVQPAAGDSGGAVGAAFSAWHEHFGKERKPKATDSMKGGYLGPTFNTQTAEKFLQEKKSVYQRLNDNDLFQKVAELLAAGKIVAWFQGPMEFGPRALGARSILGDPRDPTMQSRMNLKIKFRESFRPFAPSIKKENVHQYFDFAEDSPYMLMVAPVKEKHRLPVENLTGFQALQQKRSTVPAITHVDYSARLHTVTEESNPRYYKLLSAFEKITSCPLLVNTSFNVRGEPIVCSPEDAYRCFLRTEIDYLVIENLLLKREDQPQPTERWEMPLD